jgi:hypothetical protein
MKWESFYNQHLLKRHCPVLFRCSALLKPTQHEKFVAKVIEHEKKMRQEAHAKEYLQPPPSGRSRYYNTWLLGEIPTAITTGICAGSSGAAAMPAVGAADALLPQLDKVRTRYEQMAENIKLPLSLHVTVPPASFFSAEDEAEYMAKVEQCAAAAASAATPDTACSAPSSVSYRLLSSQEQLKCGAAAAAAGSRGGRPPLCVQDATGLRVSVLDLTKSAAGRAALQTAYRRHRRQKGAASTATTVAADAVNAAEPAVTVAATKATSPLLPKPVTTAAESFTRPATNSRNSSISISISSRY